MFSTQFSTQFPLTPTLFVSWPDCNTWLKTKKGSVKKARTLTKRQWEKSINKRLHDVLGQLRLVAGIRDPQQPQYLNCSKTKCGIFIGATNGVTGRDHPKFWGLGCVYFLSEGMTHYPMPPQPDIPLSILEGSTHLRKLLAERVINQASSWAPKKSANGNEKDAATVVEVKDEDDDFEIVECHVGGYEVTTWVWVSDHEPAACFNI
ncbi:hypothetical protein AAF712_015867 [Marasmius tenuissimus]|uniref:Transposase n=1 Tax=Marasmius tenuissimus TaxID=585030 RepID=A0ABR2Z823_9AGAR